MSLKAIVKFFDDFFFKPAPVHTVAILRIALGVLLFFHWFSLWNNLDFFWSPDGIISLETAVKYNGLYRFGLFELLPDDVRASAFLALLNLFGVIGMTLGLFTRTSTALTFLTLISFHNRNIFILNSADVVLRNFLFLMILSPAGDCLSLDRLVRRWRGTASVVADKSPWALRLMQVQLSVIYIATVMFKLKGNAWVDGTAVYTATRLDEFVRFPLPLLNHLLLLKLLTWGTLAVEFALGTLIWIKELRYWVLLAGISLHLGIEMTMIIPLFEWVMIAMMIVQVPPQDMKKFLQAVSDRLRAKRWTVPESAGSRAFTMGK